MNHSTVSTDSTDMHACLNGCVGDESEAANQPSPITFVPVLVRASARAAAWACARRVGALVVGVVVVTLWASAAMMMLALALLFAADGAMVSCGLAGVSFAALEWAVMQAGQHFFGNGGRDE